MAYLGDDPYVDEARNAVAAWEAVERHHLGVKPCGAGYEVTRYAGSSDADPIAAVLDVARQIEEASGATDA